MGKRGWVVVVAGALLLGCKSEPAADLCEAVAPLDRCPSAPLDRAYVGASCEAPLDCVYASPALFGAGAGEGWQVRCGCEQGLFRCRRQPPPLGGPTVMTGRIPACPPSLADGDHCEAKDNRECLRIDPSSDPFRPRGQVCACDQPGPLLRCVDWRPGAELPACIAGQNARALEGLP